MSSHIKLFGLFVLLLIAFSCKTDNSGQKINESDIEVSEANPNGDSELALLMRQLFVDGETIKKQIQTGEGNITDEYIELIEKCHSAIPTDPDVKTNEFTAFNNILINEANLLLNDSVDSKEGFNSIVNKCMQCHEVFCPGPMKRIKKLYIQ